ncbi:FGGY-family carbohydrate kinase [Portibacter lacus]|uniref:Carbohydrate kinase n=1 Tax=Portibacter lacus TaxID=1099794 RepID=A0AA37SSY5_9BACT|nr:FGGY family carbohydrate kinase [Portibacter lacus]GLR18979.1 hypothetical protein GCM10007940_35950 [Portibacter lacus]
MTKVTAIFDIGKTNKKFFLFDQRYQEVYRDYITFPEIVDEDGHPTDNLAAITEWIKSMFEQIKDSQKFDIKAINFSTYGASLVHLDRNGEPIAPLYNYTKEFPEDLKEQFFAKYGPEEKFELETASPYSGFLNSGLQLYWLKYTKPEVFQKIKFSLHLPQYISYLFTDIPLSDYTSLGCHTGLWDFSKKDYHRWVYEEEIDRLLPPLVTADTSLNTNYFGRQFKIGVGIHDSSSAMLPYIMSQKSKFTLLSTGTWSVALTPGNDEPFSKADLAVDSLNYMRIDGKPVRASRLFLGNEYKVQVQKLSAYFNKEYGYHRDVKFDDALYDQLTKKNKRQFHFESIPNFSTIESTNYQSMVSFEEGFHQLMIELMEHQLIALSAAIGSKEIKKLFVDGGFADNDIFINLLSMHYPELKIRTTKSPLGSALGAAMVISDKEIPGKFLKKHYKLKKI